jgi:hypothetical protein
LFDGKAEGDRRRLTDMKWTKPLAVVAAGLLMLLNPMPAGAHDEVPPQPPIGPEPVTTPNMRQLAHVNPGPTTNGDVYGFGRHAYLASWIGAGCRSAGIRVYDLTQPTNPVHVSTFADKASEPDLAGTWTEKVIVQRVDTDSFHGDLAVVTFQTCVRFDDVSFRGFALYDVTDPARPRPLARYSAPNTRGSHEIWLGAHAGKAYVYTAILRSEWTSSPTYDRATNTATVPGRADFRIVDVSNPWHMVDVAEWGAWRELGVVPVGNPANPNAGFQSFTHSVRVDERLTTAYLSNWDLGTIILDITSPARPTYVGRTQPHQGATHSSDVDPASKVLVETHETLGGLPAIYDISNPANPVELSHVDIPGSGEDTVHDPKLRGSNLLFSWYSKGIIAVDVAHKDHPRVVGQFFPTDAAPNPDFCNFEGGCSEMWGVFALGDLILASDMNNGLYVLKLTGP